jgi:hypothetical protein
LNEEYWVEKYVLFGWNSFRIIDGDKLVLDTCKIDSHFRMIVVLFMKEKLFSKISPDYFPEHQWLE